MLISVKLTIMTSFNWIYNVLRRLMMIICLLVRDDDMF